MIVIELFPRPTKQEICGIFGVDEKAFLAAQRRLERSVPHHCHDRRQMGTEAERQSFARLAKELGNDRNAQSRVMLAPVILETLKLRDQHFKEGKRNKSY